MLESISASSDYARFKQKINLADRQLRVLGVSKRLADLVLRQGRRRVGDCWSKIGNFLISICLMPGLALFGGNRALFGAVLGLKVAPTKSDSF